MTPHTPTPWYFGEDGVFIGGTDRIRVADVFTSDRKPEVRSANARFIVRAVNSHDTLVAALRRIVYEPIGLPDASAARVLADVVEIACAALALAREGGEK